MRRSLITNKNLKTESRSLTKNSPWETHRAEIDIGEVASLLKQNIEQEAKTKKYASVRKILLGLAIAGSLPVMFMAPKSGIVLKLLIDKLTEQERDNWRKYNLSYLHRTINLLHKQKLVEIRENEKETTIIITENGRRRILKYALEELTLPHPKGWDKKWRLIIFDVPEKLKYLRNRFRQFVKNLGLLRIQKSAYLYPYPCHRQIEFLREYLGVGDFIIYAVVEKLEDDEPYRQYFGL